MLLFITIVVEIFRMVQPGSVLNGTATFRIRGGEDTKAGQFPYQVAIQYQRGEFWRLICGGSILTSKYVLTAAHCDHDGLVTKRTSRVMAGSVTLKGAPEGLAQYSEIKKFIHHPLYSFVLMRNDIAIILLATPIDLTAPGTGTVQLPTILHNPHPIYGKEDSCNATGWGSTYPFQYFKNNLQWIKLTPYDDTRCLIEYLDDFPDISYKPLQTICAGTEDRTREICGGDSGGPLVCEGHHGEPTLFGIASFGNIPCTTPSKIYPSGFTEVRHFLDWISLILSQD